MTEAHEPRFTVTMEQLDGFEFKVKFDWEGVDDLLLDEPAPLGGNKGPNAARLVAAAVGNCLSASLLFCLQRSKVEVSGVKTVVNGSLVRNEQKRLRIGAMDVRIELDSPVERARLERCLGLFEDYCVVTQSVREGIEVGVEVVDPAGATLFRQPSTRLK